MVLIRNQDCVNPINLEMLLQGAHGGDIFRTEGVKTGISFVDSHTVKVLKSASLTTFTLSLFHHL